MKTLFLPTVLALTVAVQADAATYNYQQAYLVSDGGNRQSINETDNFVALDGDVERTRSATVTDGAANSTFSINRADGVVKMGASLEHDTGIIGQFATTRLEMREIFTATGTGTATFRFDLDGTLFGKDAASALFEADMRIARWTGPGAPGQLTVESDFSAALAVSSSARVIARTIDGTTTVENIQDGAPGVGELEVSRVLELSYDVLDGSAFSVAIGAFMRSSVGSSGGTADADFLSTGYLSFETSDGLSLTASDPLFLSGTTGRPSPVGPDVPAVPLPASAILMLAALGGLGLTRRRSAA